MPAKNRIRVLYCLLTILFCALAVRLAYLMNMHSVQITEAAGQQGSTTLTVSCGTGVIYDCNLQKLVNDTQKYVAVVQPSPEGVAAVLPHVLDRKAFYQSIAYGKPFTCLVDTAAIDSEDVRVFTVPIRNGTHQLAQHLIGYLQNGVGVSGLEAAYDSYLRSISATASVTFSVDGSGAVLSGEKKQVRQGGQVSAGLVTTLHKTIQTICEEEGAALEKGVVLVMDCSNGDVLGLASFPNYDSTHLEDALQDPDSPLINRACYAYNVGSIFKLVTAADAKSEGLAEGFRQYCTGSISVGTQLFRCHDTQGHGWQTMKTAMMHSCNPYFIALSQKLSSEKLLQTAKAFGFGEAWMLADGIPVAGGTLPTRSQMDLPAEQANFCFGQGVLTATPLQIGRFTCAIANGGMLPTPRCIKGKTKDGITLYETTKPVMRQAVSSDLAAYLQSLMVFAAMENSDFQGKPDHMSVGAKTSTAQTGRYDENGVEYCHGWVTGFFPAEQPQYTVTVLAEDGGYGNEAAAPIFRSVIERITEELYLEDVS